MGAVTLSDLIVTGREQYDLDKQTTGQCSECDRWYSTSVILYAYQKPTTARKTPAWVGQSVTHEPSLPYVASHTLERIYHIDAEILVHPKSHTGTQLNVCVLRGNQASFVCVCLFQPQNMT